MTKIIPTILTTIILINFGLARGKNKNQLAKEANNDADVKQLENILKNMEDARIEHEGKFMPPTEYFKCGPEARVRGEGALVSAHRKYGITTSATPEDLKRASCEYGLSNGYHWARFTFTNEENKVCTVWSVFKWITPKRKQNTPTIFELEAEFTKRANKDEVCRDPESASKIQIDKEPEVVQPEVIQPEVIQVYGPAHTKLPSHPQTGKDAPAHTRNELSLEDDEEVSESEQQTVSGVKHTEHDDMINRKMMGGWVLCDEKDKEEVPKVFSMLVAQNLVSDIIVYTQNVIRCERQLVNGLNYNLVMSFSGKECQIAYHKEFKGQISLMKSSLPYHNVEECTEVYRPGK